MITVGLLKDRSSRICSAAAIIVSVLPEPCVCQTSPRRLSGSSARSSDALDGADLVLAEDDLLELVVPGEEDDPAAQELQEPLPREEPLHLLLEVARLLVLPVEDRLPVQAPRRGVEEADQVRDVEDLGEGHQLRRLLVVAPDLLHRDLHPVLLRRRLRLDHRHGDAVDQEDDVRPVRVLPVRVLPLVGDVKQVVRRVLEVDDDDVAGPLLRLDVDRPLAPDPGERLGVAFDVGPDALDLVDD